jgi:hypothetical protein
MTTKNLAVITLATATLAFGQIKLPKLSDMKDKLSPKTTTTTPATPAATDQSAANQAATANTEMAKSATAPATAPAANEPFKPLPAGSTKVTYQGQGIELTICEKGARQGQWDVACVTPARTFEYKGGNTAVYGMFKFDPPLTSQTSNYKVQIFKNGNLDEYREITFQTGGKTAVVRFSPRPGLYTMKVVEQTHDERVALTDQFVVAPDTVGDRVLGNMKSGVGKLMICSTIDDNWKCVGESTTWDSKKPFNMYVTLPEQIPGTVCGWAIYKQNPDGSDGNMVDDMAQGTQGRASKWATTNGNYLPPGKYTIYSITWASRTSSGNFKNYFAKTTLTVQ